MFNINKKCVLIIGASQGIGFALAKHFHSQGATVIAASRGHSQALKQLGVDFESMDISSDLSVSTAFANIANRYDKLDVLINNAGVTGAASSINDTSSHDFQNNFNTNVIGMTRCIRAASPLLTSGSSIINTASLAAHLTVEDYSSYSLSKAAVIQLTRNAAMQLGKRRIRVNSVSPGTVLTAMEPADGVEARLCAVSTALGHPAHPNDLLGTYQYLASDASAYVTGIDIRIDGGWIAGVNNRQAELLLESSSMADKELEKGA